MNDLDLLALTWNWECWNCRFFIINTPFKGFFYCLFRKKSLTDNKGWTDAYWICPYWKTLNKIIKV